MAVEEGSPLNIVVDTNVIVAALIQQGIVRELVLGRPGIFMTPEACIREAWENREDWNRKKVPEALVKEALDFLTGEFVSVVPRSVYREKEAEAAGLIRDPDDGPVVALALAVDNEGIWTFNTKDFSDPRLWSRCRIPGTAEVSRSFLPRETRSDQGRSFVSISTGLVTASRSAS